MELMSVTLHQTPAGKSETVSRSFAGASQRSIMDVAVFSVYSVIQTTIITVKIIN